MKHVTTRLMMDEGLRRLLQKEGLSQATINVLIEEEILSFSSFYALKTEHLSFFKKEANANWPTCSALEGLGD